MIRKSASVAYALLAVGSLLLAGCSQLEPAKQAIAGVEQAIDAASAEAGKYVPDQLASAKASLAELKTAFDAKDYATVVAKAPAALESAKALAAAAVVKKDEAIKAATAQWGTLSTAVPAMVAAVKSRVDALGKHAPKGVDLAAAKASLAEATEGWAKAQAASAAGNVEDAASLAQGVKDKALAAAQALKLKLAGT